MHCRGANKYSQPSFTYGSGCWVSASHSDAHGSHAVGRNIQNDHTLLNNAQKSFHSCI